MNGNAPDHGSVPKDELERLRRIEEAAKEVLHQLEGRRRRSATPMLAAIAALRAALKEGSA